MNEELILNNIGLINKVIKDLHLYWKDDEEYQEIYYNGLVGLMNGIRTYNESVKLSTYAYTCIANEIKKYLVYADCNNRKINKEPMISLDAEVKNTESLLLYEIIPSNYNLEKEQNSKLLIESIVYYVNNVKTKYAEEFKMYYGLDGYREQTLQEIAVKIGVSRTLVRNRVKYMLIELVKDKDIILREYLKTQRKEL